MSKSVFSIQELTFHLDFYSKEKAHELQNRISSLYNRRVHNMLQDFFEYHIPDHLLIRKDSLLLDLGAIADEELETELPLRLEKALQEQFDLLFNAGAAYSNNDGFESLPASLLYFDVLEYYLLNGSFPWQASAPQQYSWRNILQELDQQNQHELGELLKELGQQPKVRRRIASQSAKEDMELVVTAIIPVEAPVILSYKNSITALQQEKQIVKTDANDFATSVYFFILTYLMEEKGSLFSQKMFIKSILLQMAAHYNMAYQDLLAVLYDALPLKRPVSHGGSSLFELVEQLQMEVEQPEISTSKNGANHPSIFSVLSYFIQYGGMPGWGGEFNSRTPESLLAELYTLFPKETFSLIKAAGIHKSSRQRVIWQFSEDLLYRLFSLLPQWDFTVMTIERAIETVEDIPEFRILTQLSLKHVVLESVWSSYIQEEYSGFSVPFFYQRIAEHFLDLTGLEAVIVIELFRKAISLSVTETPLPAGERQNQAFSLLDSYLTWNRLPDSIQSVSPDKVNDYLSEMLLLLYHHDRDALKRLLQSDKHASAARMHLHRLFLPDRKGGDHKQLSLLLDEYIENDALQYLKEIATQGDLDGKQELKPVLDRLLEGAKGGATNELTLLLKSAPLTKYMARNYGEETVSWLIDHRSGSDLSFKIQSSLIRSLLLDLISDSYEKQRLRILLNEATLFYLSGLETPKNIKGYLKYIFRFLSGSVYTSANLFTILLRKIKTDVRLFAEHKELVGAVRYELEQHSQIREQEEAIRMSIENDARKLKETEDTARARQIKSAQELLVQHEEQKRVKKMDAIREKGNKLYVNNSGLVLLHPFLSTYFTHLNLMEKGDFIHLEARARAVHLLQYLAFNTTQNPEHELVLNKILCNYPLQEPLALEINITPEERELSLDLLKVVIERSGKLSSTSVEGFQVSFLQRQAVVTETEEAWMLRVEQRGYDIILQTLPWAFGMIKFQWMDKMIHTEWI